GLAGRSCDQREPQGPDRTGPAHADAARRKSHQDALRPGRRQRAHTRRSRPIVRRNPRTHPPDRSQSAAEAAASVEIAQAARVHGRRKGLTASSKRCHSESGRRPGEDPASRVTQGTASVVPFSCFKSERAPKYSALNSQDIRAFPIQLTRRRTAAVEGVASGYWLPPAKRSSGFV